MAKTPKPTRTAYRRHGDLPAYFQWRDGRPCWLPSQGLRDAGWKRSDFKDADGRWLSQGAAIDAAAVINDAVALWRDGRAVPAIHAPYAPAGACAAEPVSRFREDPLSIGALMDAYAGVKAPFRGGQKVRWIKPPSDEFAALQPSTQRDYANKLKRGLDVLAGWPEPPGRDADDADRRAYAQAVAETRADSIFSLQAEDDASGMVSDPLLEVYRILKKRAGVNMAAGVMATYGAWLAWCRRYKSRRIHNWAAEVERETPPGRIRPLTWAELQHMVKTAEAEGYPSIADAIILGVDLTWSQADRLDLTWPRVNTDETGRLRALTRSQLTDGPKAERVGRQKTGRVGGTPFLSIGRARVALIAERQRAMAAQPTHVIVCETTGAPWKADHYRHTFAEIRTKAAATLPSLADVTDQDLRDTGITLCRMAGLTIDETCARTLQSRRRVLDLWDQAYGEIGPEIANAGADRLDAYLQAQKVAL